MITYPALEPYAERYADMAMEPLSIVLTLKGPSQLAGYDPLNLDNLLARCVVDIATYWHGLPPEHDDGYDLPVPLKCLWRDANGFPLWAATPFYPVDESYPDVFYWHKRNMSGRFTGNKRGSFAITSTKGRYMERRTPLPTKVCRKWRAVCIGNAAEIGALLAPLAHVGKKRSIGFGEVDHWEVEPADEFTLLRDGHLIRSFPAMAIELLEGQVPAGAPASVGWTPPQWKPSLFAPGWWPGAPMAQDWFNDIDHLL